MHRLCITTLWIELARRTKEEAAATRELLLDTAERMFLQRGVGRTSLNDIAHAAGLTRGAVYWHFEDKTALYNALMDRFSDSCQAVLSRHAATHGGDALATLRATAMTPLRLMREDPRAQRLFTIVMHRIEFSEDLAAIWARHVDKGGEYRTMMEDALRAAQAQGGYVLRLPLRLAATGLFALVDGLLTYATVDPAGPASLEEADSVIDTYLAGLGFPWPPGT